MGTNILTSPKEMEPINGLALTHVFTTYSYFMVISIL